MDTPAASADVHVSGRCPSASKSHTAADAAFQLPSVCGYELYSSYSQQLLLSSTNTCRSPVPGLGYPSIGALAGTGIGPGSLSSPYAVKLIATGAWSESTTI